MSADPRNTVTLIGGLVDVPELVANDKIARFRIAVDYASSDPENRSGYFVGKMFLDDSFNAKFVRDQMTKENFKKGSQVAIVGRLEHNRYEVDGQKRSDVNIIIEGLSYVGGGGTKEVTAKADTPSETTGNTPNW